MVQKNSKFYIVYFVDVFIVYSFTTEGFFYHKTERLIDSPLFVVLIIGLESDLVFASVFFGRGS